ncbi:MAG: 3-deoxy-7-phosphoheptulonate synthase [Kiritimatiellia bacterium]|jgi:3-deoxy-7-phosphoheptulonate synthase
MNMLTDKNIDAVEEIITPRELRRELPLNPAQEASINRFRETIEAILDGRDVRLLAVVGPCSIHDIRGATEFASKLSDLAHELSDSLFVIMRVYFEKPRGQGRWSGLITDPFLDGGFRIEEGLRMARKFLMHLVRMDLPCGTEALDPIMPQYLGDLFSWMAIGQRASESNAHREMASGLSMPVGFKNAPYRNGVDTAIQAIRTASRAHAFLGVSEDGMTAVMRTKGNAYAHLILRGGDGPNYGRLSISDAQEKLRKASIAGRIVVDCSHGNSEYDPRRQEEIMQDLMAQIERGDNAIVGFMLESYLEWGSQPMSHDPDKMDYGVSVTDPCIDWETTERILREAADRFRRVKELLQY